MEYANAIFLLILSFTPGLAIAYYIYLQDVHEPEPVRLVLLSLFFGALSVMIALAIIPLFEARFDFDDQNQVDVVYRAFIIVALVEESCKFLFLRGILFRNKNFNEPFDGIVYAVMIGMGFAMTENIIYVVQGVGGSVLLRMFTAVPAHAIFGVVMGYFLGKVSMTNQNKTFYSLVSLLSAVVMHGLYDYFLFTSFLPGLWLGAAASLFIGYFFARRAIKIHQDASPFKE